VRYRLRQSPDEADLAYRPKAWVIAPFKGDDDDVRAALEALLAQNYPRFHVVCVLEDRSDRAYPLAEQTLAAHPPSRWTLVMAGRAPAFRGQKVHNQLAALEAIAGRCEESDVYAFVDSDVVAGTEWLARLIEPLRRTDRAASTGYRWFFPEPREGASRVSLWTDLASVMNSSVVTVGAYRRTTQAWGGSMALRDETARAGRLRARWDKALTDDFPVTHLARDLGKRVRFQPQCLARSEVSFRAGDLFRFAHRQYLITRVYAPRVYALALVSTWGYVVAAATAWIHLLGGVAAGSVRQWILPAGAILAVAVTNQVRATLRAKCVRLAFGSDAVVQLRRALILDRWATPAWMALHGVLALQPLFTRVVRWRRVRYRLLAPDRVERLEG
jgi:cellulose synthase/poly-beta-1,6-N-acetylglucosamine synthase-like glycosyltransferase